MNLDNRIHIAISPWDLTDDYNRHAGVTLLSILEHSNKPVVAHILYDNRLSVGKERETEYNKSCYQQIADKYGCIIQYHHIEVPDWVVNIPSLKKWTVGTLLRLHLVDILPSVDRIIYFDCDMVVRTNVDLLWETDLHDTYLGACLDSFIPTYSIKRKRLYEKLHIPIESYFCAGLLLLNLKKIRQDDRSFTKILYQFLYDNQNLPFLDQDMLNWYFQGKYTELDEKYNIYTTGRKDALQYINDGVLHYAAVNKPWKVYWGIIDNPYWDYLKKTPWGMDSMVYMSYVHNAPDVSKALPYIKENIFLYLSGTPMEKTKYALTFICSILLALFKGILYKLKPI